MSAVTKAIGCAKKLKHRFERQLRAHTPVYLSPVRRIDRVAVKERVVAMTFDDGPCRLPANPSSDGKPLTLSLLETLEKYGAKGTFDIVGDTSKNSPDMPGKEGSASWGGVRFDHYPDFGKDADGGAEIALEDIPFDLPAADSPSPLGQDLDAIETIPEIEGEESEAVLDLVEEGADFELPLDDFVLEEEASDQSEINLHVESSMPDASTTDLGLDEGIEGFSHPEQVPASLDDKLFVQGMEDISELESLSGSVELPEIDESEVAAAKGDAGYKPDGGGRSGGERPELPVADIGTDEKDPLRDEVRNVLSYLDKLLDSLPDDKIEEFARSEHFETYKRLFEELGLA